MWTIEYVNNRLFLNWEFIIRTWAETSLLKHSIMVTDYKIITCLQIAAFLGSKIVIWEQVIISKI